MGGHLSLHLYFPTPRLIIVVVSDESVQSLCHPIHRLLQKIPLLPIQFGL
jgi:hypothetical protein